MFGEGAQVFKLVPVSSTGHVHLEVDQCYVVLDAKAHHGVFQQQGKAGAIPPSRNKVADKKSGPQSVCSGWFRSPKSTAMELGVMAATRGRVCAELATTERTYCDQLAALENVYINPLRSQPNVLSLKCSDVLFSNIMSIKAVNEGLLSALEQRADDRELGRIFCDFCPMLQMYHDYAKYNHEANNLLAKLLEPETSRFKTFVEEAANAPEANGLKLTSFLIAPIQVHMIHTVLLLNAPKYPTPHSS
jgi:hypothetical protein